MHVYFCFVVVITRVAMNVADVCLIVSVCIHCMLDAHTHLPMQADLNAFDKLGDQHNVFTGCADVGDAVVVPPGFIFVDLSAHSGFCGLKLNYMHRGCLDTLTALKQDASLFKSEAEDPVLAEVIQENVT